MSIIYRAETDSYVIEIDNMPFEVTKEMTDMHNKLSIERQNNPSEFEEEKPVVIDFPIQTKTEVEILQEKFDLIQKALDEIILGGV